jgi:hypothetical protein
MACPECGKDPSSIVAYEPIGLADLRPVPPVSAPRPTRAQLEQRIRDLEAELTSVRASTPSTPSNQDN